MKIEQASPHREKVYLFPDADISWCTNWFPSSGSKGYLMVTEYTATRDTSPWQFDFDTYIIWHSQSSGTELFKFTDLSLSASDIINYVKVNTYARCYPDAEGEDEEYYLLASPSAACTDIYASDDKDLTTGWKKQSYIWTENPATSSTWTQAEVNAAAFGVKGKGELGTFTFEDRDDPNAGSCTDIHVCVGTGYVCAVSSVSLIIYQIATNDTYVKSASIAVANATGVWAEQARQSGTVGEMYVYCSCGADGLRLYYYNGAGTITLLDTIDDGGDYKALHGWSYNDIHFIANGNDTSYTKIAVSVGTNGLYFYNTTSDDYDVPTATRLQLNDTINDSGGDSYEDVFIEDWNKTNYSVLRMHATCDDVGGVGSHVRGYTWTPSLELVANGVHDTAAHPHGIKARESSNPLYDSEVFIACTTSGILALGKDNTGAGSYTQIDSDDQGGDYRDVALDPNTTYIYASVYGGALPYGIYQYEYLNNKLTYITKVSSEGGKACLGEAVDVTGVYVTTAEYAWGARLYKTANTQTLYVSETWLEIDYTVSTTTCYLTRPEGLSSDHKRNINMLNFWNGEREVYGINRSGKSLVLNGKEYYQFRENPNPCARINCVRDVARRGDVITLSDLSPTYFNGNYRIRQFGWKKVSSAPTVFNWILSLEDAEK